VKLRQACKRFLSSPVSAATREEDGKLQAILDPKLAIPNQMVVWHI
jgi:hypothetical protein